MEEQIYYLSGPMTGIEEYNYPMFNFVAKELREQGLSIVSPAETEESLGLAQSSLERPWDWWMRHALRSLLGCNNIIMLPGWYRSRGARAELDIALDLKMEVHKVVTRNDPNTTSFVGRRKVLVTLDAIDGGFAEYDG